MAIYLQIIEDNNAQHVRIGARPIFIGRSSKCHITINDNMVSGKHIAIKINSDSHVVIKDLDTTNGTYLNGNKIDESLLYLDDFIQVGLVKMSLVPKEMTSQELKVHQRDFERTNVTFVKLGNQIAANDDFDNDSGLNKQRTLLAKIREKNKQKETNVTTSQADEEQEVSKTSGVSEVKPNIVFDKDLKNSDPVNANPTPPKGDNSFINEDHHEDDDLDEYQEEVPEKIPEEKKSIVKKKAAPQVIQEEYTDDEDEDEDEDEYEYEYVDEEDDEPSDGLVSKLKGLFKR